MYSSNTEPQKQETNRLKGNIDNTTIIAGDFNIP